MPFLKLANLVKNDCTKYITPPNPEFNKEYSLKYLQNRSQHNSCIEIYILEKIRPIQQIILELHEKLSEIFHNGG